MWEHPDNIQYTYIPACPGTNHRLRRHTGRCIIIHVGVPSPEKASTTRKISKYQIIDLTAKF